MLNPVKSHRFCIVQIATLMIWIAVCVNESHESHSRVCYRSVTRSIVSYRSRAYYDSYSCGLFWWRRCRRTRYRSESYTSYYTDNVFDCCSGYRVCSYSSRRCCDINECSSGSRCDQRCVNTDGSYRCSCRSGYLLSYDGRSCSDKNECTDGTAACSDRCHNTIGSYYCSCRRSGYRLQSDMATCQNIDECAEGTDSCAQDCTDTYGSYQCSCRPGFRLASDGHGCNDINECEEGTDNCAQACINTVGSFRCGCNPGYQLTSDGQTCQANNTQDVAYQLYVNPADPIIASAKTPEGDTIFLVGSKTSEGLAATVDEFHVVNDEGTTYVHLDDDGAIQSAIDSNGSRMELIWGENYTSVLISILLSNATDQQQILINVDLMELAKFNDTVLNATDETLFKRDVGSYHVYKKLGTPKSTSRHKRQPHQRNSAKVDVHVKTCEEPELNAQVFADVLQDYDEQTGSFSSSFTYVGKKSVALGKYEIYIPTSVVAESGRNYGDACDAIEMVLSRACGIYSNINKVLNRINKKLNASTLVCDYAGRALTFILPYLRPFQTLVVRICKTAFKGVDWYCNRVNKNLTIVKKTPAQLFCDAITEFIDTGIDTSNEVKVFFTPSAVFPTGNTVSAEGKVLTLSPGSNNITTPFYINNDRLNRVEITSFEVSPVDPAPFESYEVTISYKCYSSSMQVTMSIVGTDNYRNTITCTALSGPVCKLSVPGAYALVMDTVTVGINDPGTSTSINRTVTIIF